MTFVEIVLWTCGLWFVLGFLAALGIGQVMRWGGGGR